MKIYTKTGDKGETGLLGGIRVFKNDPLIHAIGEVDELNTSLGVLITLSKLEQNTAYTDDLVRVQHILFSIGANLAQLRTEVPFSTPIKEKEIFALEALIDELDKDLSPLTEFVLPGGSLLGAHCFMVRAVCRRTERSVVHIVTPENAEQLSTSLQYLNRLSDTLFTLARWYNLHDQVTETPWIK